MQSPRIAKGYLSLSKVHALSGACAYLVGDRAARGQAPAPVAPWSLSLPAQLAVVHALEAADYYRRIAIAPFKLGQENWPLLFRSCFPHDLASAQGLTLARWFSGCAIRQEIVGGK